MLKGDEPVINGNECPKNPIIKLIRYIARIVTIDIISTLLNFSVTLIIFVLNKNNITKSAPKVPAMA